MDIYQCMTCGERWPHEGLERNMDIALVHQGQGHEVRVGNIDRLAREYKIAKKSKAVIKPNDAYNDPQEV
jgi:hypothetical protein